MSLTSVVLKSLWDTNYDILALSETWLNSAVTNAEVETKGYKLTQFGSLRKNWRACGIASVVDTKQFRKF